MNSGLHIAEETLEEYAFGRVQGAKLEEVEDHLFQCDSCRSRLEEAESYVRAFKMAAGRVRRDRKANRGASGAWQDWLRGWATPARSLAPIGAVMSLAIALLFSGLPGRSPGYVDLTLEASRGGEMPRAAAGHYYRLHISSSGLSIAPAYAVWITDASGATRWRGAALPESGDRMVANVGARLEAGTYWAHIGSDTTGSASAREHEFRVVD